LGVTFYELLTGNLPFDADSAMELVHCHIAKTPKSVCEINPAIPPIISDIVMKLMAKNVEDRYQSAFGVKADLEKCLENLPGFKNLAGLNAENLEGLSFQLAQNDFSGKLQIPQKLYGRENEINTLLQAFERVSEGAAEMMLVAGYSGVGKTALVHEVHKPMTEKHGYFAAGKFDQFQKNIPYSAISQAFNQFCRYLLMESAETLANWQTKILAAVGNNGQIIIDVIPDLELVIGPQPAVAEVGSTEAQNRFQMFFLNFVKALCEEDHPFILFIDDLQWVDLASLTLLKSILLDSEINHLLIIGAYRDNEVDSSHPLMMTVDKLQKEGTLVNTISLQNLSQSDVNILIAEALICQLSYALPLTQLVSEKTQGNAFFTREFLKSLFEQDLLAFDVKTQKWQWDINDIKALSMTDNVVELITNKIHQLPVATQNVLKLASCIGNLFDLETVSIIYQHPQAETQAYLWKALEEGLLFPLDNNYQLNLVPETSALKIRFKFQHDRIQQAAYALIAETDKVALHLQIGRLLKAKPETLEERLFEIVDHLNIGRELVDNPVELDEMVRLNLKAGQKAKAANAYEPALNYLDQGMALLPPDSWNTEYELTFSLQVEQIEALYLNTRFEQSLTLADRVLSHAKTRLDQVKLYELKIQSYISNTQMTEALDSGLSILRLLDITLLETSPLYVGEIEDLLNLPLMINPAKLAAMRILMTIMSPAFIANPSLLGPIAFTMVDLSLKEGNSPPSAYGYSFYGLILCVGVNEIERGYQFGQLALKLVDKLNARDIKARTQELFHAFVRPWKEHPKDILSSLYETIQIALEVGDIEYASYSAGYCCIFPFLGGTPLESVQPLFPPHLEMVQRFQYEHTFNSIKNWKQLVLNLSGQATEPTLLIGPDFNEIEMRQQFLDTQDSTNLFELHVAKGILLYFLRELEASVESFQFANQYQEGGTSFITGANGFYYSLSLLAQYPNVDSDKQSQYFEQVSENQAKLEKWAYHAPMNYQHKDDLLEAEKARVLGQDLTAMDFYEKAIAGARKNEYLQEEALAYELAAEFYLGRGMKKFAQTYMKEAHYRYQQWGAVAKVTDLEERYPQWLTLSASALPFDKLRDRRLTSTLTHTSTATILASNLTRTSTSQWLDLDSIMKASQTLTGEIGLSQLLEKMMQIVIENAGAQRGFLILPVGDKWVIEAEGAIDKEKVTVLQSLPIENHLPEAIINYVARTQENVVLVDASHDGIYTENPYIKAHQTQSVLCFPIVYQQQLRAILYFENNLSTGAFTSQRLNVLQMLSNQIAISLENAQVMAHLDTKVKERTVQLNAKVEELTQTRQELVQSEKMASLGRLVAGFAHELNTPLGVALGSASLLQREAKKINQFMEQDEVDEDDLLSVLESIEKAANLNVSNLKRAANLVTSFKRTAVDQTSDTVRTFQIQQLIQDTINTLHSRFKNTEIDISVDCPNDFKVKSLPGALEQILTNLLMNSLIHGFDEGKNAGSISIKAQLDEDNLHLEYSDNGKGIVSENLAKIFEPFFTTHRAHGGSGLGMYICYNLVTQLQGTITCESQLGEGVVFKIDYPTVQSSS
jgi:predicted ATPase/signal transduction histidine kinase